MAHAERATDYTRLRVEYQRHHERWKRRVTSRQPRLICQECGGAGGEVEPILDDGSGPWYDCGYCEGTGYVDGHRRAEWLRWQREEKQRNAKRRVR